MESVLANIPLSPVIGQSSGAHGAHRRPGPHVIESAVQGTRYALTRYALTRDLGPPARRAAASIFVIPHERIVHSALGPVDACDAPSREAANVVGESFGDRCERSDTRRATCVSPVQSTNRAILARQARHPSPRASARGSTRRVPPWATNLPFCRTAGSHERPRMRLVAGSGSRSTAFQDCSLFESHILDLLSN
jgi:hypothetical protein